MANASDITQRSEIMQPFHLVLGRRTPDSSIRSMRGPLIVTSVQDGRLLEVRDGPPWESDSRLIAVLDGKTFRGEVRLTASASLAVPFEGDNQLPCIVSGFELDETEAPRTEETDELEARWGIWRREGAPRRDDLTDEDDADVPAPRS